MSIKTNIQWCDSTINPTMGCGGCELWSEELKVCYAGREHQRKASAILTGWVRGYAREFSDVTRFPGRVAEAARWRTLEGISREDKPWLNDTQRMVFVSDMSDALSHHKVEHVSATFPPVAPNTDFPYLHHEIIKTVSGARGRRHLWLWLTKRPNRMAEFSTWLNGLGVPWPSNLWVGTSITERKFLYRIDHLREVGNASTTRFLSLEPQIDDIALTAELTKGVIHWVIQGGESGARVKPQTPAKLAVLGRRASHIARTFDIAWARSLATECRAAGVPYFLKQLGTNVVDGGTPVPLVDRHGGDWSEWPEDIAIREVPGVDRRWSRR